MAKAEASPGGTCSGVRPRFFQPSIIIGKNARRPALLVDVLGFEQLLHQPDLIVDVENGEIGLEPDQFGVAAQDFHADRMEGAEPRHAFDHVADDLADAVLHLARRLVGEGHRQNFARPGAAGGENVGDAHGQHARLAGAGAGQHQHRPVERLDREPLLRIEPGEIGRVRSARAGARSDPAWRWRRRFERIGVSQRVSQRSARSRIFDDSHGLKMALAGGFCEATFPGRGAARQRCAADPGSFQTRRA